MLRSLLSRLTYTDEGIALRSYSLGKYLADLPKRYPRLFLRELETDKLLMGGESGHSGAAHARRVGDLLRPSRPIAQSPHAELLRSYQARGEALFSPEFFQTTPYYKNAINCIALHGKYFGASKPEQIICRARKFCQMLDGKWFGTRETAESEAGSHVVVRPIRYSDCFEIVDGHHRAAIASVKGGHYKCVVLPSAPVLTPIQDLILASNWTNGRRETYQPLSCPELRTWPIVRHCEDRFAMMRDYLSKMEMRSGSYLDICCSYGWFLAKMGQRGFQVLGVDQDRAAVSVGQLAYGLDQSSMLVADLGAFLGKPAPRYDIVSCFSVLHHYVLGAIAGSPTEFIRSVDRLTRKILFFDTGECHEGWFRDSLAGWNIDFITKWLKENSSFTRIEVLGTDSDNVAPYEGQYQRHLLACSREG